MKNDTSVTQKKSVFTRYSGNINPENPRYKKPAGFNAGIIYNFLEINLIGKVDYFINPQISLELTAVIYHLSLGANYHLNRSGSISKFTPYTGLHIGLDDNFYSDLFIKIPVGICFIAKSGFTASCMIDTYILNNLERVSGFESTLGFQIGWRF